MPEKSVREMSRLELRHYSLENRVFKATLLNSVIIGLVAFLIGLGFYGYSLTQQLIDHAYGTAHSATVPVGHGSADATGLADQIMDIYRGMSDEERAQAGSEAYRARFAEFENLEDYKILRSILREFKNSSGVFDVYLGMYDRDTSALVYVCDPDESEDFCHPGYWEGVEKDELERFLAWKEGDSKLYDIGNTKDYGWLCTAGVPVADKSGNIAVFVLADITLGNILSEMKTFAIQFAIGVIVVTFIIAFISAKRMKKTVVEPINKISEACEGYIKDRKEGQLSNDRFSMLNIRTGDEIENLALVMADMERDAQVYFQDLMEVTAEKERIGVELDLATKIQAAMLPSIFPAFPDRREFDIYATMDPAKEVGGDFYDFFMTDSDHLVMVMADVSGKGIPAALFMMTARTMLKDAALSGLDPARILYRVNAQLSENNSFYMFVTVWIGILEISTGKLVWADAGHEKPLYYHDGSWTFLEKHEGVAVAAFEPEILEEEGKPAFVNQEMFLYPGDVIYQYTDGVMEAMTEDRRQFGEERAVKALYAAETTKPEILLPKIRASIDKFVGAAEQFDDITMMALRYHGLEK